MDFSPLIHALISLAVQSLVGCLTGNWWVGGLIASAWWLSREHAQAEYRAINTFYGGRRRNAPWWCGFEARAWNFPSLLDAFVPAVFSAILYGSTLP